MGCVLATLPVNTTNEPQINRALKAVLVTSACWLDTDPVELRRWLVDASWLSRDGFCRAYNYTPTYHLPVALQPVAAALAPLDMAAWVTAARHRRQKERAARRQAWQWQA